MIVDTIDNIRRYTALGPRIARGLEMLATEDFASRKPGRYEVNGAALYCLVQSYTTKPREQGVWESHRTYLDVQYVVEGVERFGWAPAGSLSVTKPYDPTADAALYAGDGDLLVVRAGTFLLLWPDDAHLPGIALGAPAPVHKVVVKIRIEEAP